MPLDTTSGESNVPVSVAASAADWLRSCENGVKSSLFTVPS